MEDRREKRREIVNEIAQVLGKFSAEEIEAKRHDVIEKLFDFANFKESKAVLFYVSKDSEVPTRSILERSLETKKMVILPAFDVDKQKVSLMRVDNLETGLVTGPKGIYEPNPAKCKTFAVDQIDIAIIPGFAFDEKGGRIGADEGFYDKLIAKLPATTRKIAIAYEEQVVPQIPMTSRNKHIDIVITDKRIIYKI